ncbi:ADP-ribosylglycohydrolase family protein [Paraburkholderia sp. C35]|uniref:ADP-ribosylglycohydrolase family protein n=1 Tax=Paraburkholderia sp. C35 TaxID=2126993 RepID=UPI000D698CB3|nr:ADP-ribosylglycohydrolase family protein [Paraburkholderia sp. C35]
MSMPSSATSPSDAERFDRARGAFYGLALGDAFGMPTQSLSRVDIQQRYGRITRLLDSDADQPIAPNMSAGSITDDTEQAVLVAQLLVDGHGTIEPREFAQRLIEWEAQMKARGSLDLLGPSTRRATQAILDGEDVMLAGRFGTTNGAAMRVTPVGIAASIANPEGFIDAVVGSCVVTHNTTLGIASAAAVAAAVSAGIDGASLPDALAHGAAFADRGEQRGFWVAGARIGARLRWAADLTTHITGDALADYLYDVVGTSVASQESVVAAFALAHDAAHHGTDITTSLATAASLGGDTDTIAAMLGAMLGACAGYTALPPEPVETVIRVNALDLDPLIRQLLDLRASRG